MTIKEATKKLLWNILIAYNIEAGKEERKVTAKEIAEKLGITPTAYSRLSTGVNTPKVITWYKIVNLHRTVKGDRATEEIINQIE